MTKIFNLFIIALLNFSFLFFFLPPSLLPEWPRWAFGSGAARSGPELGFLRLWRAAALGWAAGTDPQRDPQGAEDQGRSRESAQGDDWQEERSAGQPQLPLDSLLLPNFISFHTKTKSLIFSRSKLLNRFPTSKRRSEVSTGNVREEHSLAENAPFNLFFFRTNTEMGGNPTVYAPRQIITHQQTG